MFSIRCMYIFLWKFGVRFYRTDQFGGYCKSVLRSKWYAGKRGKRIFVFFVKRISSKFSKVATPSLFISVLFYSRALHREINPQRVKFSTPHVSGQCHPLLLNPFGTNVDHGREPPGTYVYGWRRLSPMAPSSISTQSSQLIEPLDSKKTRVSIRWILPYPRNPYLLVRCFCIQRNEAPGQLSSRKG